MRIWLTQWFLIFYFFVQSSAWAYPRLERTSIRNTMDKLIEYHIQTKQVSQELLLASIDNYISTFDKQYAYLTEQETHAFTRSNQIKKQILHKYLNHDPSIYEQINHAIQDSIYRARSWRIQWLENSHDLIQEAQHLPSSSSSSARAKSIEQLQINHRHLFLSHIAAYLHDAPVSFYEGKESALANLIHKQLSSYENLYLGLDEYGAQIPEDEGQHQFYVRIIKALANSLDAHTAYFSEEEATALRVQLEKGMCGLGIVLKEDVDGIVIKEILPGGAAEQCGNLFVGDIILSVDDENIRNHPFRSVLEKLKGQEMSSVKLGVQHPNNSFEEISLQRTNISLEDRRIHTSYEPFGSGIIGKISLYSFYEGDSFVSSEQDIKQAIQAFQEHNLLGLILDIRDNNGGFLSQAVKVAGLFMKNGIVVVSKYADGSVKKYRTMAKQPYFHGPMVILVSKNSASAAEIVAQTLQDYGIAIVVGDEHTYGKGTIQHQTITNPDPQQDFFKVTIGKYYSPSGKSTQLSGVIADILVPTRYAYDNIGERFLDNPIPADSYHNVMQDTLDDIDRTTVQWFQKYYLPNLQTENTRWKKMLPILSRNSQQRLQQNTNFSIFTSSLQDPNCETNYGNNDLPMEESVNIIKDMILLQHHK